MWVHSENCVQEVVLVDVVLGCTEKRFVGGSMEELELTLRLQIEQNVLMPIQRN